MRALDERLSALLRLTGDGVIETDRFGVVIDINPVAEALTGWLAGSAVGEQAKIVFRALDAAGRVIESPIDRAISTGKSVEESEDFVLLSKDGKKLKVSGTVALVLSGSDGVSGVFFVFKKADRILRGEDFGDFRLEFENLMADLAFRFATLPSDDVEGALDEALGRIASLFDVDRCSVFRSWRLGMNLFHQWNRESSTVVEGCPPGECCCIKRVSPIAIADLSSDDDIECPAWWLCSQGVRSVLCIPIRGKSSVPVGVVRFDSSHPRTWDEKQVYLASAVVDMIGGVILRREMEVALRESEARSRKLVEESFNGIAVHRVILDEAGKPFDYVFLEVNQAFEVQTGLEASKVLGRSVREVLPGIEETGLIERYGDVVLTGRSISFEQFSPPLGKHYAINAYRVGDMEFATVFKDISDRKDLEDSLIQSRLAVEGAERAKSDFLSNMSHEIRTPLNGVIGMAHLLWDTDLTEEQRDFVLTIASSGEALLEIISEILDFSKVETGKLSLEKFPFEIGILVEETLDLIGHQARAKGLELMGGVSPDVPIVVEGDPGRIRQVLINLLSNAVKFTREGYVSLSVSHFGTDGEMDIIRFEVTDTGIGIPSEKLADLFKPFTQADPSATRSFGGTGLGLAISKKLIDLMGGRLEVDSREGEGTSFSAIIPMRPMKEGIIPTWLEKESFSDPVPVRKGRSPKILVVEDTVTNRKVIVRLLEKLGYRSDAAANGKEALQALSLASYDGVLMDIQMPEMDGLEATRRIRERERRSGTHIPIVALTAHVAQEDRDRCLNAGMDGHLPKPVRLKQLADALERMVPSGRARSKSVLPPPLASDGYVARDQLLDLIGSELEILAGLISSFEDDFPRLSDLTSTAIDMEDWEGALNGSFRMKEMLSSLAAWEARETASLLEDAARSGDREVAMPLFKKLRQEAAHVLEELYSIREQMADSL